MFEEYENLSLTEKETFERIVNALLSHTFLLVEEYDPGEGITRVNKDYLFVERNFELFKSYLSLAGFSLNRDAGYGVISLGSRFDGARVHFDKMTTIMVYALRLIYEEEREKLTLSREVILTTGDLVHKLISLGAVKKKPANMTLSQSLRSLAQYRLIKKLDGPYEDAASRLMILPTILFVVSAEQISNMNKLIEPEQKEDAGEETSFGDNGLEEAENLS